MATGRLAVLSNVNMNMVIRMLQKQAEVYDAEGYGNELGALLNPASSYHAFQPDITFLIMDLAELLEHDYDPQTAKSGSETGFRRWKAGLPEHGVFYVSDAYLWRWNWLCWRIRNANSSWRVCGVLHCSS